MVAHPSSLHVQNGRKDSQLTRKRLVCLERGGVGPKMIFTKVTFWVTPERENKEGDQHWLNDANWFQAAANEIVGPGCRLTLKKLAVGQAHSEASRPWSALEQNWRKLVKHGSTASQSQSNMGQRLVNSCSSLGQTWSKPGGPLSVLVNPDHNVPNRRTTAGQTRSTAGRPLNFLVKHGQTRPKPGQT